MKAWGFLRDISRRDWLIFSFMIVLVPLAGEPRVHPFTGDFGSFRVSFGSPVFLLFLLWLRSFPRLFLGVVAGFFVMLFRASLDVYGGAVFYDALVFHVPNFFYYFFYALFFALPDMDIPSISRSALIVACWAIFAEFFASVAELSAMNMLEIEKGMTLTLAMLAKIFFIAVMRCFFILSFFFLARLYTAEVELGQRTRQATHLSLLISGLYQETFELRMSFKRAEEATRGAYNVYNAIRDGQESREKLASDLLRVAGEVHDIKKETQRIYASLAELTANHHVEDFLPPRRTLEMLLHSERKYADRLGKKIFFHSEADPDLPALHVFTLLSMLGNLVSNAVEAIKGEGAAIEIRLSREGDDLLLSVKNTGSFISARRLPQVMRPGYTTKFDSEGRASSGVGLSYVAHQAQELKGTFTIDSDGESCVECHLTLPLAALTREAQEKQKLLTGG